MHRHIALLFLLSVCSIRPAQAGDQQSPSLGDAVGIVLYSGLGAANPPNSGKVLMAFGLMPDDNGGDSPQFRAIWTVMLVAAGGYDNLAGQRKASQGSVFAANLVILGTGFYLACKYPNRQCGDRSPVSHGLYLAPLPRERGMELGYHWSF
jgi:hypothetical protein